MSARSYLVSQFSRPHGFAGRLAGWIMATRRSNQQRNLWTIGLLDVQPAHRVLDIGCGPGFALSHLSRRATQGEVTGLDHSATMLAQARRRNARAVREGRIKLVEGSYDKLPDLHGPFDRIMAVNALQFSGQSVAVLANLRALLRPGGMLAVTFQSRAADADDQASRRVAETVRALMVDAGFTDITTDELQLEPACAVCIRGTS
jgi:trans-aconitate methyltransferase